jgi:AcrR family transcriptional regulator
MKAYCPIERLIRRRRKDARPGEITAAALEVFAEKGFAATRLDDIAARAGVSKGTVYLYFEHKEALFKAAVEAAMMPAVQAAEALADDRQRPAVELLREFADNWWQMVGSTALGAVPKLLVAESGNFPELARWFHDTLISRAHRAMVRIIEQGIAAGDFRPVKPAVAARIVFAPMFSYLLWRRTFADFMSDLPPPEEFIDQAVDLLSHGLVLPESRQ